MRPVREDRALASAPCAPQVLAPVQGDCHTSLRTSGAARFCGAYLHFVADLWGCTVLRSLLSLFVADLWGCTVLRSQTALFDCRAGVGPRLVRQLQLKPSCEGPPPQLGRWGCRCGYAHCLLSLTPTKHLLLGSCHHFGSGTRSPSHFGSCCRVWLLARLVYLADVRARGNLTARVFGLHSLFCSTVLSGARCLRQWCAVTVTSFRLKPHYVGLRQV